MLKKRTYSIYRLPSTGHNYSNKDRYLELPSFVNSKLIPLTGRTQVDLPNTSHDLMETSYILKLVADVLRQVGMDYYLNREGIDGEVRVGFVPGTDWPLVWFNPSGTDEVFLCSPVSLYWVRQVYFAGTMILWGNYDCWEASTNPGDEDDENEEDNEEDDGDT